MKWFDNTALTLVIIGALNWLLVGIFKLDIVAVIFGQLSDCAVYISSAFMEELEVHPKKGVSVIWMPLLFGYTRELATGNFSCILWYEKCLRHILMHQLFSGIASTIAVISL